MDGKGLGLNCKECEGCEFIYEEMESWTLSLFPLKKWAIHGPVPKHPVSIRCKRDRDPTFHQLILLRQTIAHAF